MSSGGVLLNDPVEPMEIGQPIEYMITLPTGKAHVELRLRCMGKVVRVDDDSDSVAVTLERYEFVRAQSAR